MMLTSSKRETNVGDRLIPTSVDIPLNFFPKAPSSNIDGQIIAVVGKFGDDVEISPKKTYVSLRRSKQFALVQPSTRDRVDVGINLKGEPADGRLEASGSFNAMVSHRVRVTDSKDVNAELKSWLKKAYDAA